MRETLRAALTIYAKDVRLELRTRETLFSVLAFAFVVAFIFTFAFEPSPQLIASIGPGIVWVAWIFTAVLGMNRTFLLEHERGTLDGLRLAPVPREALYLGKLLSVVTLLVTVEALMLPAFLILYDLSLFNTWFIAITLAATVGIAAVGTLFSAIAVHTRAREVLLPMLFLPVALPLLIGAVTGARAALDGEGWDGVGGWLQLIVAFDVVFLVLSSLVFEYVLEE